MNNITIADIIKAIEIFAPPAYQESYDNSGLLIGNEKQPCTGVLLSLDATEQVVEEAIQNQCNFIIAHHPILFMPIKQITGKTYVERTIIKAIQNNIAIYAAHTNMDNVYYGVNYEMAQKLALKNLRILYPQNKVLKKIVTFVPPTHLQKVQEALFNAGCGNIGNYDSCSFFTTGNGTFKGNENTNPFIGEKNKLNIENEIRLETIFESHQQQAVIKALMQAHPYEEPAYDIYLLENHHVQIGSGMIGEWDQPMDSKEFLDLVKTKFNAPSIRYTEYNQPIKKVALCGGSGAYLLNHAIKQNADVFLSSDFKYHQFFDAENKIMIVDIGHFEAEQFTPQIFYTIIKNKFPNFTALLSQHNTNPIKYH